jgi:surfeit locus 1 family protein
VTAASSSRKGLLAPSIAAACAFAILIGLGVWQVKRLAWKEALIATVSARLSAAPTALPPPSDWPRLDPADDEFRRVTVSAEFLNDKEALVFTTGSSLRGGESGPGYWVFVPARISDGTVMVNRGFVPEHRKDAASRRAGEVAAPITIVGVMRWPEQPGLFTPEAEPAKNLWFARDSTAIAAAKSVGPVAPFYVELESPPTPGGFPLAGALQPSFPNNHLGYAITWFGLAAVLAASFTVWAVGQRRQG